jgi:hypothetical protein
MSQGQWWQWWCHWYWTWCWTSHAGVARADRAPKSQRCGPECRFRVREPARRECETRCIGTCVDAERESKSTNKIFAVSCDNDLNEFSMNIDIFDELMNRNIN